MPNDILDLVKDNIVGSKPELGEALKWYSPGKFYVDYTGIPAEKCKEMLVESVVTWYCCVCATKKRTKKKPI